MREDLAAVNVTRSYTLAGTNIAIFTFMLFFLYPRFESGRINSVLFHQLAFDHGSVGNDLRTSVLENKCSASAADWIGDAARAA